MMKSLVPVLLLCCSIICTTVVVADAGFTVVNGQIFTRGLVIIDAPQPDTPLGGDDLNVALDISGDGKLSLPSNGGEDDASTRYRSVTIFLSSYVTGLNFTVTNGTEGSGGASLGDILVQEEGSTVKHVNWVWPDCFVGNGNADDGGARGLYNISIHQSYTLNSETYYTITDLPITTTNSIPANGQRPSCDILTNPLLPPSTIAASTLNPPGLSPWIDGNGDDDGSGVSGSGASATTITADAPSDSPTPTEDSSPEKTITVTPEPTIGISDSTNPTPTDDPSPETTITFAPEPTVGISDSSNPTPTPLPTTATATSDESSAASQTPDLGGIKPDATPEDGLGAGARPFPPGAGILGAVVVGIVVLGFL